MKKPPLCRRAAEKNFWKRLPVFFTGSTVGAGTVTLAVSLFRAVARTIAGAFSSKENVGIDAFKSLA